MKENTFTAILSIAIVAIGGLVVLAEMSLLVNHGVEPDVAFLESLYSGFLGWVILAASLISTDKFWKLTNKIIKK